MPPGNTTPPLEEVVAEAGMPTVNQDMRGQGQQEAPAASSAGNLAAAAGQSPETPGTSMAAPASAEEQQGQALCLSVWLDMLPAGMDPL